MDIKLKKHGKGLKQCMMIEKQAKLYKYFPNVIRGAIIGSSNSGKTNLAISILTDSENGLLYTDIHVISSSLYQPKYVFLKDFINVVNSNLPKKYKQAIMNTQIQMIFYL